MAVHLPVLSEEVIEWIRPVAGGTYVDATIGLGGHAERILEATKGRARLVGLDWDEDAVRRAEERLKPFGDAVEVVCSNFVRLPAILEKRDIRKVQGILFDLGVSSLQLEDPARGFSLQRDGPLDMRMSRSLPRTAADLLRLFGERELEKVLRNGGEERWARRIARAIGRRRGKRPPARPKRPLRRGEGPTAREESGNVMERTRALAEFIERLSGRRGRIHPATRVFQALRIAVNGELENLAGALEGVEALLAKGGRALFLSFHSLEDRLVKRSFREKARAGSVRILTPKPGVPGRDEIRDNPRARSAKLRVMERI